MPGGIVRVSWVAHGVRQARADSEKVLETFVASRSRGEDERADVTHRGEGISRSPSKKV